MSKQLPVLENPAQAVACCTPMSQAPLEAGDAADLAGAFKALGDPIRLQLMSMIASAAGGEMCVCDLTPAFEVSGPNLPSSAPGFHFGNPNMVERYESAAW